MDAQARSAISLRGVCKSFGTQRVHDGVDLDVPAGKTTVIVGPSGVGKSVLLKYILGLMRPDEGDVLVAGESVPRMGFQALRRMRSSLGVLFQGAALFDSMNVYDNVALPLRERTKLKEDEIRPRVMEKLAMMRVEGSAHKYPAELSGGMQKRVGLARALQNDPRIVLFDEPTTGLDPETSVHIYRLFAEIQQRLGYTALIVSHDVPRVFRIADFVAFLKDGHIQACLSPAELKNSRNPYVRHVLHLDLE